MPTYEYECSRGHQFEAEQRISDPPLTRCRVCRSKAHRLISRTSFVLKGGGWYSDGYGGPRKNGGSAGSESKTDGSAGKSESAAGSSKSSGDSSSGTSGSGAKSASTSGSGD
jgi:putative FmdB family regulatory protein